MDNILPKPILQRNNQFVDTSTNLSLINPDDLMSSETKIYTFDNFDDVLQWANVIGFSTQKKNVTCLTPKELYDLANCKS
jgi:hypothetical protein